MLVAPGCAACGAPLDDVFGGPVCPACRAAVRLLTPPWCPACGQPLTGPAGFHVPGTPGCHPLPRLAIERAAGWYDGSLRAMLHAFKYRGCTALASPLAALVRTRCGDALDGADACVPVPLHWRRRLSRGYNQAALLASGLGLPVRPLLRRRRATPPQAGLHAAQRPANVGGAFVPALGAGRRARGAVLVLVDDVRTTGSTLAACAAALAAMGAAEVRAVTVARVEAPADR